MFSCGMSVTARLGILRWLCQLEVRRARLLLSTGFDTWWLYLQQILTLRWWLEGPLMYRGALYMPIQVFLFLK